MKTLLAAALLCAGCVSDIRGDPLEGSVSKGSLRDGAGRTFLEWPDAFRRGGTFVLVNATGVPIETLFVDLSGPGAPREISGIRIEDPPGWPATILPAPHGTWPLRAQLGAAGHVLLPPGGKVRFVVVVEGTPSAQTRATITVPALADR